MSLIYRPWWWFDMRGKSWMLSQLLEDLFGSHTFSFEDMTYMMEQIWAEMEGLV
jgi:hypothetical protein